jgi:flagellar protein FlgJ
MKHKVYLAIFAFLVTGFISSYTPIQILPTSLGATATPQGPFEQLEPTLAILEKKIVKFQTPAQFVEALLPFSKKAGKELGIDPKLILAQAAHETDWGRSIPKHKDGSSSFNLFGLKGSAQGKSVKLRTKEFKGGKSYRHHAHFRAYDDYLECFTDYVRILSLDRYQRKIQHAKTAQEVATGIQRAGFATDPLYAKKLMKAYRHPALKNA